MRQVWKMNLKDNRDDGKNIESSDKFNECRLHNLIAIGWNNCRPEANPGYHNALNSLIQMKRGDLVWVKNPQNKNYYICEILNDNVIDLDKSLLQFDMSKGRIAEFYLIDNKDLPPQTKSLTTPETIQRISQKEENFDLIMKTILLFKHYSTK